MVTVGLQQSYFSAVEGQGSVSIAVLCGDITGSSFNINYFTSDGLAEGIIVLFIVLYNDKGPIRAMYPYRQK